MFCTQLDNCTPFVHIFDIIFLFASELEEPKIGLLGKGLLTALCENGCKCIGERYQTMSACGACCPNSLPNDKILDRSKLKAFADNKINVTKEFKFV